MLKPLQLRDTHVLSGFVVMVSMRKSALVFISLATSDRPSTLASNMVCCSSLPIFFPSTSCSVPSLYRTTAAPICPFKPDPSEYTMTSLWVEAITSNAASLDVGTQGPLRPILAWDDGLKVGRTDSESM